MAANATLGKNFSLSVFVFMNIVATDAGEVAHFIAFG
jgi:hypothetical protein